MNTKLDIDFMCKVPVPVFFNKTADAGNAVE